MVHVAIFESIKSVEFQKYSLFNDEKNIFALFFILPLTLILIHVFAEEEQGTQDLNKQLKPNRLKLGCCIVSSMIIIVSRRSIMA